MLLQQSPPRESSRFRRPLYALGAAALAVPLALSSTIAYAAEPSAETRAAVDAILNDTLLPDFQSEYLDAVVPQNIWDNDYKLAHEIGPRVRGSEAEMEAINWVSDRFVQYGLEVEVEEFELLDRYGNPSHARFADVTPSRYTEGFASWQFGHASNGPLTTVSGDVVDIAGETADLAARTDLAGKIVLANWNTSAGARTALLTDLKQAGVAAVVFTKIEGQSSPEGLPSVGNLPAEISDMVVLGAALNQGNRVRTLLADGPLSLSVTTAQGEAASHNLIGTLPAASGDPDAPIIYLGAHIDSVTGSTGASDNGSGVSILVEIARIVSQYSYDYELRFGVWGAEEGGIVGSNHHVKTVMTQEERDRTLGAWNMDMAGTSYPGTDDKPFVFWALTADDSTQPPLTPDQSPVLQYSNDVSLLAGEGDLPIGTVGRSDHQPFYDMGIPAAVFSWMHWAGGNTIVLEPAYHQTTDTLEFVSAERMGHAARILGGGAFRAAMNEVSTLVTDASGEPVADARVVASCEGDEGWREVGTTDAEGRVSMFSPNNTCDLVALTSDGARGIAAGTEIDSSVDEVEIVLEAASAPVIEMRAGSAQSANGWFTESPATVLLSATNDFGDDMFIEYSFDGETWQQYVDGVSVEGEGSSLLFARASDPFGNSSDEMWLIDVDSVAPALQVSADANKRGAVSGTVSDATSGVASVQYRIGSGEWVDVDFTPASAAAEKLAAPDVVDSAKFAVELKLGGEATSVQFRAFDVAGNVTNAAPLNFAVVPGGLSNTGAEAGMTAGIAAAALLLVGGGALLVARRFRSRGVSEEA